MSTTSSHNHHHHHHHRPLRDSVVPPPPIPISRHYPSSSSYYTAPLTPSSASTPSKRRPFSNSYSNSSLSSSLLVLFSLRSLYSLLPFLRSTPSSFYLFPFSFLVSLLSLLLLLLLPSPHHPPSQSLSLSSFFSPSQHLLRPLAVKSSLIALILVLRFQALRYCGAAATILAEFSGALLAASLSRSSPLRRPRRLFPGFASLALCLSALSLKWDRVGCFPLSFSPTPTDGCVRVLPMLLPFLSGFLGFHERASTNWASLRQLGRKRARVASLALATAVLFVPASISFLVNKGEDEIDVSVGNFWWPLVNTVIFGVILSENYGDEKLVPGTKDLHGEFLVTFFGTLVLELFYFPKLSLSGFLFCGILLWISVRALVPSSLSFIELGGSDPSESLHSIIMKPIRHILNERKSRKIALFLLINTAYMVVEFVAGFMSNSLGLISDACHMLFDCAALAIGLYASYISRLPANHQFNYGRGRFEVISGYVNAVLLVLVGALIVLESFERILDPQEISTNSLLVVSIGGLLVNVVGLIFFHEEHHHAHGGGGACSHSHFQSHQHHEHHDHHGHDDDHDHHVHRYDNAHLHAGESNNEHLKNDAVFSESDSISDSAHNHNCFNRDHVHLNSGYRSDLRDEELDDNSSDHWHGHQHHDFHHHPERADADVHQKSHEHQRLDISLGASQSDSPESCTHKGSDHGNEGHIQNPPNCSHHSNHAHCHSLHVKETLYDEKPCNESRKHHHIDHNMEGIFLHVLADTMGSVGVVISTLLIKYKGWMVADPACSIFISVMIISSVIPLLRNSAEILLQRVPRAHEEDLKAALDDIMKIKGVYGIQNLHVWNFTNNDIVASLQVHVSADTEKVSAKKRAISLLHDAGIKDITIQVESIKGPVGSNS